MPSSLSQGGECESTCLRKGFYDDGDHLSFFLVHYDFKIMFCYPPKSDFTIRWHVPIVGLENMLPILATVRWALSVRCTAFYRVLTPGADALLSRWWLKREQSNTVKGIPKAGHSLAPREKQNKPHVRRCWQDGKQSCKAGKFLFWLLCMPLLRAAVLHFSLHAERGDPPEGCPLSPSIGKDSWTITTCFRKDNVGDPAQENREHCILV